MIAIYLLGVIIVNIFGLTPNVIDAVNALFNSDLSGTAIFWYGLLAAFILGLLTND